ncbi:SPOSA6832_02591, partial [Sporobolomyces salmonicolor]
MDRWIVTMGNEAGDLDSLASSVAYATFANADPSSSRTCVPLVLTARSDLYLRPENVEALSRAHISDDSLLTIDDLPPSKLSNLGTSFALVDHNVLLPTFRSFPDDLDAAEDDRKVLSILDHHADESRHLAASPRLIQPVGSCASLVATHFSSSRPNLTIPSPIADLLLSAILIDTRLKPSTAGGKATPVDLSSVDALLPFSSFARATSSSEFVQTDALEALKAHHDVLSAKKSDVSWMRGRDLLRRDYKEYVEAGIRYGLATVPLGLDVWLDKASEGAGAAGERDEGQGQGQGQGKVDALLEDVRAWMAERGLGLCGVLTSYTHVKKSGKEGKHRRELLIVSHSGALDRVVFDGLEADPVLELEEWKVLDRYGKDHGERDGERWKVWNQGNTKATRKQVAPALKRLVLEAAGVHE